MDASMTTFDQSCELRKRLHCAKFMPDTPREGGHVSAMVALMPAVRLVFQASFSARHIARILALSALCCAAAA